MERTKKGFTLVELVIVIAVIAILASVLIPTFAGILSRAKNGAEIMEVTSARDEYLSENLVSPSELENFIFEINGNIYVASANGEMTLYDGTLADFQTSEGFVYTEVQNTGLSNGDIMVYQRTSTIYLPQIPNEEEYEGEETHGTYYITLANGNYVDWDNEHFSQFINVKNNKILSVYHRNYIVEVYMPETITSIGGYAFSECSSLEKIAFSPTIVSIGEYAFQQCVLMDIEGDLPTSLTEVGTAAFLNCKSINGTITIPSGVTSVPDYAFSGLKSVDEIIISNSVTGAGVESFAYSGCTSITLSNTLSTVGQNCFSGNSNLLSLTLPTSITRIENNGFSNCTSLRELIIPEGFQPSMASNVFSYCSNLMSLTIPSTFTNIGSSTFWGCYRLVEVINKSSLSLSMGSNGYGYVAKYAKRLVSSGTSALTVTDGVVYYQSIAIGPESMDIETVSFKSSCSEVNQYAFSNCKKLTTVNASNISTFGEGAFKSSGISEITLKSTLTSISDEMFNDCKNLTSFTFPASISSIGKYAFANTGLENLTIPASVGANLSENAFSYCKSLNSLTISYGITQISRYCFTGCTSITEVIIPDSVTTINSNAFYECKSLRKVTLGSGLTSSSINSFSFSSCDLLEEIYNRTNFTITPYSSSYGNVAGSAGYVYTDATKSNYVTSHGVIYNISNGKVAVKVENDSVTDVVIDDDCTKIETRAFYKNQNIRSVIISNSVTQIGQMAFNMCYNLNYVKLGTGVTQIGDSAFRNCTNLYRLEINSSPSLGYSVFDGNVNCVEIVNHSTMNLSTGSTNYSYIARYAKRIYTEGDTYITHEDGKFYYDDGEIKLLLGIDDKTITSIVFDSNCTGISNSVFMDCVNLESVDMSSSHIISIGKDTFRNCINLRVLKFSNDTEIIDNYAFAYCESLEKIKLPDSLERIGEHAFWRCINLYFEEFPESLTTIGMSAFNNCLNLSKLTFKSTSISFASYSFNCTYVTDVTFESGLTSLCMGEAVFYNQSLENVFIPNTINHIDIYGSSFSSPILTNFVFEEGSSKYYSDGHALYSREGYCVCYFDIPTENNSYTMLSEVEFASGTVNITSFSSYMFQNTSNIQRLILSSHITSIDDQAFFNSSLKYLYIPASVTWIGSQGLCTEFDEIVFEDPNNWYIGYNAEDWDPETDDIIFTYYEIDLNLSSPTVNADLAQGYFYYYSEYNSYPYGYESEGWGKRS